MTDTASAAPSDAEIDAQWRESVEKHETTAAFVRDFARTVLAKWGAPPQISGFTVPQADSQPALPKITAEDRSFLHDNPNTDDIVEWVHNYASAAVASDRAARAPADSVTAPAGAEVVGWLPVHSNGHKFYGAPLKTEAEAKQYINQVHQSSDSVTLIARPFTWIATPPAQAADSVLEDAARYRFLSGHCRSTSEHWGGRWSIIIDGPAPESHDSEDDFDAAVDAARAKASFEQKDQ